MNRAQVSQTSPGIRVVPSFCVWKFFSSAYARERQGMSSETENKVQTEHVHQPYLITIKGQTDEQILTEYIDKSSSLIKKNIPTARQYYA